MARRAGARNEPSRPNPGASAAVRGPARLDARPRLRIETLGDGRPRPPAPTPPPTIVPRPRSHWHGRADHDRAGLVPDRSPRPRPGADRPGLAAVAAERAPG